MTKLQVINFEKLDQNISDSIISKNYGANDGRTIAQGCTIENEILKVGANSRFFYLNGNTIKKEIAFEEYWERIPNLFAFKKIQIPSDLDVLKFNWWFYQWEKALDEGKYIKKDAVSVAKTDRGNYVVFQDHPRRAIVVLPNGKVERNDEAVFGNAKAEITNMFDLGKYKEAIAEFEAIILAQKIEAERKLAEKIAEMEVENRGHYIVELPCYSGVSRERWTNWRILANSQIEAYNEAVKMATAKGYYGFAKAINCKIEFVGVWSDFAEQMYA